MIAEKARKAFESVLAAEELADPSRFKLGFFAEVPLYSRYTQVKSLAQYGDVNRLLVEFSCNYLKRVTDALAKSRAQFFAAITFLDYGEDDPVVPSVFLCVGQVRERCRISLSPPRSKFARVISRNVEALSFQQEFVVLEDRETVEDEVKVFLGQREGVGQRQITLNQLTAQHKQSTGR